MVIKADKLFEQAEKKRKEALKLQNNPPQDIPTAVSVPNPPPKAPEKFTDVQTGQITGVQLPDGRTLFGKPEQLNQVIQQQQQKEQKFAPLNSLQPVGTQQAQQQQVQQLAGQIGQAPTNLTPQQQAELTPENLSFGNVAAGAIPDIAAGAVQAAAVPVATGVLSGNPAGLTIGAAAGATAAVGSIVGNLKQEFTEGRTTSFQGFQNSEKNLKAIITGARAGTIDPVDAVNLYNFELAKIERYETELNQLAESEWLSKARPNLNKIESFKRIRSTYDQALLNAISKNQDMFLELPPDIE